MIGNQYRSRGFKVRFGIGISAEVLRDRSLAALSGPETAFDVQGRSRNTRKYKEMEYVYFKINAIVALVTRQLEKYYR